MAAALPSNADRDRYAKRRRWRSASAAIAVMLLSACTAEPGRFVLNLTWGPAGPPDAPSAAIFARVVETALDGQGRFVVDARLLDAPVLAESAPVSLDVARLDFAQVPNGDRRVVLVEVRESAEASSQLLRYGVSQPFSLRPGEVTSVAVQLDLIPPPEGRVNAARIDGRPLPRIDPLVNQSTVQLRLSTDTGVRAIVSNYETLPAGTPDNPLRETFELDELELVDPTCDRGSSSEDGCQFIVPVWDLNLGVGECPTARCNRVVFVQFIDANGQRSSLAFYTLAVDARPARLASASVGYRPDPDNVLPTVTAARAGAVIRIDLAFDEDVRELPGSFVAQLTTGTGARSGLAFALVDSSGSSGLARYEAVVDASVPDGDYGDASQPPPCTGARCGTFRLSFEAFDVAGNVTEVSSLPGAELRVRTTVPQLQVDQSSVSFVRSPIGNASPESFDGFTVSAGSYFGLGPADGLGGQPLPANTFLLQNGDAAEPAHSLRLWTFDVPRSRLADAAPASLRVIPNGDGDWPREGLAVSAGDVPVVYVTGIDEAGNETSAERIVHTWFVATSGEPTVGVNPHELTRAAEVTGPLSSREILSTDRAQGLDARAESAAAFEAWTGPSFASPGSFEGAMAYDAARDRTVFFGTDGDTWEFDGVSWTRIQTPPEGTPPGRVGHAMAYDAARGRVVLFGGATGLFPIQFFNETWTWDGRRWTEVTPPTGSPNGRVGHAMVNDSSGRRVIMYGGFSAFGDQANSETWSWDGTSWTRIETDAADTPPAVGGHALAYDEDREEVVFFGGGSAAEGLERETWVLRGDRWTRIEAAEVPEARAEHAMVYDARLRRTVLTGGTRDSGSFDLGGFSGAGLDEVWTFDGETWRDVSGSGTPQSQSRHTMAFNTAQQRIVLFGSQRRTWRFDTEGWSVIALPTFEVPPPRDDLGLVYDRARGQGVLFGGSFFSPPVLTLFDDTWLWNGVSWTQAVTAANATPPARVGHAMADDAARGRVVLFGGFDETRVLSDTWLWNGTTWTLQTPANRPPARTDHEMVFDSNPSRRNVVLFGGFVAGAGRLGDTWTWNGVDWTELAVEGPSARHGHAMAFDEGRQRTVLFGGQTDDGFSNETWEWDGASWQRIPIPPDLSPAARVDAAMAYDAVRRRIVMTGGSSFQRLEDEMWSWDGVQWTQIQTPADRPTGVSSRHALTFDSDRGVLLQFGVGRLPEFTGTRILLPSKPNIQLLATLPDDVTAADVDGLSVRAFCGGQFDSGESSATGGALFGWRNRDPAGAFLKLDENEAGLELSTPGDGALRFDSTLAPVAQSFIIEDERRPRMIFQCQSNVGASGRFGDVSLDYLEVRIRYRTDGL